MMDNLVLKAVEESVHAGYPMDAAAVLIIELDGMIDGMDRQAEKIMEICKRHKVRDIRLAKSEGRETRQLLGRSEKEPSVPLAQAAAQLSRL